MRFTTKAMGLVAAIATSAAVAGAQVTVSGVVTGCFGTLTQCSAPGSFQDMTSFVIPGSAGAGGQNESIMFDGTSFTGTTNALTGAFTVGSFGTLVLQPAPDGQTPNVQFSRDLSLLFTLSAPAGSTNPTTTILVSGVVGSTGGVGTRDIAFTGAMTSFTFPNGSGTITIDRGNIGIVPTDIAGRVTASVIPEPSTYALMATGLAGLVGMARRRRAVA